MKYFLFDKAQKYVTRINTEYLIEAHYTEEINAAGKLEFTLPATMRLPKNVFYVCVTDPDDETSYLMFKIITEKVTDEQVTYTCIENAYDELASYTYIKDKRPTAIASAMLQMVLDGTRWSVGTCPEVSPKFCSFYYISVLEAIQKIVNLWDFEVQFQVKIDGITNEIKQRNINLYTKLGKRTNKRFEYGSNLLSVTQANDNTGLYTALVGRGKGVQVSNGDTDTDPDGYGRRITFADVVWSTQNGNPLNKPKGQEYLEDPSATAAYGFPDGHPRIGFVVFQDCEDPNELIQLTYNKLQEVNHPQVQFSASIADVGSLNLGDTIAIIRHDIGIEYYTRVFKVVHDLLDSSNNTVELGDNIAGSNSITQQISNIQNNQSNVQNAIDTIVMGGSDGNKLFFGTEFPANGTDGDVFYKTLENGGTEMYIYKDGGWQLIVSTEELDAVQKKVDEQTAQIQQAVDNANGAVSKADDAVSKVESVKSDLQSTVQELQGVSSDLNIVKQQAQAQGQTIVDIQTSTSALETKMADVKGNVTGLQQTATSLQSAVENNKNDISVVKQIAEGVESTVTNMKISSANLLPNTFNFLNWETGGQGAIEPASQWNTQTDVFHGWGDTTQAWIRVPESMAVYLEQGKQYTYSVKVWNYGSNTGNNFDNSVVKMYINSPSNLYGYTLTEKVNNTPRTYAVTFTAPETGKYTGFNTYQEGDFIGGSLWTAECMLVEGNVVTAYQPSSQDMATNADVSTIKQDITGLEATVKSNSGNISQLKQTANSLQSSIQSKADISQVTQLSNTIQSTVQTIGPMLLDGDFSDKDLSKYWEPWDTTTNMNATWVGGDGSMKLSGINNDNVKYIYKYYMPINGNLSVTYKGKSKLTYSGSLVSAATFYFHFYDENKEELSPLYGDYYKYDEQDVWQDFSSTVTPPAGAAYVRIESYLNCNGTTTKVWLSVDNLQVINGAGTVSSKISQLSDDINLRVQKGNLLSQINIEAGQTLIQSDKLYLDASSVVFSGNAFIPSAVITDLSADKITTGTLNGANVHVINIDVKNLVGDTESFVRSQWQSTYGAYVNIDSGGMSVGYGDFKTSFNTNGMQFISGGEKLGGFSTAGMENRPSTYQGLMCSVGGDAEFFAIGAQDYHNTGQNPVPPKLVWMRNDVDKSGYNSGWNFQDQVWTDQIGINSINYGKWNIKFKIVNGSNGFSALTLTSGTGDGFYWGSDGSFGYVTGGNVLFNLRGTQIVNNIGSDGICRSWTTI